MVDTVIVENETAPVAAVSWPAVLAGAAVAGAFSLMMLALGSGIGLSTFLHGRPTRSIPCEGRPSPGFSSPSRR